MKKLLALLSTAALAVSSFGQVPFQTGRIIVTNNEIVGGASGSTPITTFEVTDSGTATPRGLSHSQYNNGTNSAQFNTFKARGTRSVPLTIVTGDVLGRHIFWGHDGTQFIESANIRATSSGTIGTNRVPSQLEFYTSTDAAPSVLTQRLLIDNAGVFTFNSTGATITAPSTGAFTIAASGSNQSITLTPSGTGLVSIDNTTATIRTNITSGTNSPTITFARAGTPLGVIGSAGTSGGIVTGSLTNDLVFRSQGNAHLWSVDSGTSYKMKLSTAGNLLLGGLTTDGTGVLQFPAATTSAGGWTMGTDLSGYRVNAGGFAFDHVGGTNPNLDIKESGTTRLRLSTNAGAATISAASIAFGTNGVPGTTALTLDSSQNATFAKLITSYNGIATAGNGVVTVQGAGRATAQTAANASVATYTVGSSDASFVVSANVRVTTSSAEAFTVTVDYTDEGNTARTATLNFQLIAGTIGTAINFANGAVPYEGIPMHIRCKASTAITFKTAAGGTYTGCVYNVEGVITKLQ